MSESYNGWSNYPTWAVNLWLANDEATHHEATERIANIAEGFTASTVKDARVEAADELKSWVRDELTPDLGASFAGDLLGFALDQVDWLEIADSWLEDADVPDADTPTDADAGRFVVIESTPGYMPDDDEPATFTSYAEAVAYLNERAAEYADDADANYSVTYGIASCDNLAAVIVYDGDKMHDLGRVIEIRRDDDDDDDAQRFGLEQARALLDGTAGYETRQEPR